MTPSRRLFVSDDEADYLLGLASAKAHKKQKELSKARQRHGQTAADYQDHIAKLERVLAFFRHVEDKLILHVATGEGRHALQAHHRARLRELGSHAYVEVSRPPLDSHAVVSDSGVSFTKEATDD